MKAIMVMYDSLNRRMLPNYGNEWVKAPNFERLQENSVVFDNCYAGSLPCMPARRELHTGRYNFLHRSWGPIEPFDDSMPEILKNNGVYTHLVSDHYHYWEDGGCTYHSRYNTWEIVRGQEGDQWKPGVTDPPHIERIGRTWRQEQVNRYHMQKEEDMCQARTFKHGLEFIEENKDQDNWFLQIETFDPHEPFFSQEEYKELYPHNYRGPQFDWPEYDRVTETSEQVEHMRYQYASMVSMCDHYLGKVLDLMDRYDMWKDTMLIVNTDHGYLLAEHDWWAKCVMPFYNEISHLPLFIWDPRSGRKNTRRKSLVQTIDLAPTLLDYFDVAIPDTMIGKPLADTVEHDEPVREAALFGMHGGHINCTDGTYVYMQAPQNPAEYPHYNYTLMPTHMREMFTLKELRTATLSEPFSFTRGCKLMKIKAWEGKIGGPDGETIKETLKTLLFDVENDPKQLEPFRDVQIEEKMRRHMVSLMQEHEAPEELYKRMGLEEVKAEPATVVRDSSN
jgi:arylsulfatase A-like enzyme